MTGSVECVCVHPFGPECIFCKHVVCMDCDDVTDVYDINSTVHKCHLKCADKAQDMLDQATIEEDVDEDHPDTQSDEPSDANPSA